MRMTANKRRILACIEKYTSNQKFSHVPNADEIARDLDLDRGSVRRTLYNMEKQGLVRREKVMGYYAPRFDEIINRECVGWVTVG